MKNGGDGERNATRGKRQQQAPSAVVSSPAAASGPAPIEGGTREVIVNLVGQFGPITAAQIAERLQLTGTAVRRHLDALADDGRVETRKDTTNPSRRGRPAKAYVLATSSHESMPTSYDKLAIAVLEYMEDRLPGEAIPGFARAYVAQQEDRLRPIVEAAGDSLEDRVRALAAALSDYGHSASARTIGVHPSEHGKTSPGVVGIQLCQGHCPIHGVAQKYPEMCQAEAESFARLLGAPVRRLATLAHGDHVCTTHIGPVEPRTTGLSHETPRRKDAS